jgi:eukaryotic-like serine/threonine-protein kinase
MARRARLDCSTPANSHGARPNELLSENNPMDADEERARWVFLKAVAALKPEDQAAIVDRECAGDPKLRSRVEELLAACQEANTVLDERTIRAHMAAPQSSDGTVAIDSSTGSPRSGSAGSEELPITERDHTYQDREPVALTFLQPSSRPGSLGRLNQYEVLEVLGKGGFGIVVRAFDETLQRVVAIKVLSPELAATSPARKRFLREARASAKVRHENVVQIYSVEENPIPYLVMEYIPGQTLQQRLEETGPLEVTDVLRIGGQIARGLAAAHQQGLIHRDIKPGNILLESGVDQKVKITDFGLARAADDASLSQSGVIAGTPLFMAPEQASGGREVDPRSDIYALGAVAYYLLTGRPPFDEGSGLEALIAHARDPVVPPSRVHVGIPEDLERVVLRCLAKDPAERYPDAEGLERALCQCACAGDWHRDRAARWWRDADLGTQERGEESRLTSVA